MSPFQQMSQQWAPAMMAEDLQITAYAFVYGPLATQDPTILGRFRVTGGSVTVDATNAVRRTLSSCQMVPMPSDPLGPPVPDIRTDVLFPDGNEIVIFKGVQYADGTTEVATLGRFLMEDVEVYEAGAGVYIQLNGSDRSATVARSKFTAPYSTDGSSSLDLQIRSMLDHQQRALTYSINMAGARFPVPAQANFQIGADPWASALGIAAANGYEMFFDPLGVCHLRPVVNAAILSPVWAYNDDSTSVMISCQRSLINTGVPNLVIMTSQGSGVGTPLQSIYWDSDPNSATFYNPATPPLYPGLPVPPSIGSYPTTVVTASNSTATTQGANDAAAQAVFLTGKGSFDTVNLVIRDNPAHDVEDLITVSCRSEGLVAAQYVIDSMTIPLDTTTTSMKCRAVL